jgi:hypothetical protein
MRAESPPAAQGGVPSQRGKFSLTTPSTARNAMRLLRALSLSKPVLLEGSPGVGKTSLVAALAAAAGHTLVRINLSEQSDMMDLLGADLPAAGGGAAEFSWADGPLLTALRTGAWVLLDELNLAPQAVLEGLNALLDHRREVYVPELDTVRPAAAHKRFSAAASTVDDYTCRNQIVDSEAAATAATLPTHCIGTNETACWHLSTRMLWLWPSLTRLCTARCRCSAARPRSVYLRRRILCEKVVAAKVFRVPS